MTHHNRLPHLALAIAAAALSSQAAASSPEPGPEMLRALQQDLSISSRQLPAYLAVEQQAEAQEVLAKRHFGDRYAGSWIERDSTGAFRHVVATTDTRKLRSLNGAAVRSADHSLADLDASMSALNGTAIALKAAPGIARVTAAQSSGVQSWRVDVRNNRVVVRAAEGGMEAAIDFVAASGVDINTVDIETGPGVAMTTANIFGGREYGSGGGLCSVGFAVTRGTTQGFVTAGHCGVVGTALDINGERIGQVRGRSYPVNDMAWGNVRATDTLIGFVNRYNGNASDVRVAGNNPARVGATLCRSGFASGYRCGVLTSNNVTVNYPGGTVFGLSQSSACVTQGDSGGSWITPAGQAQGVTSGGIIDGRTGSNCADNTPETYFQKVNEILVTYGLRLKLG